LCNRTLSRQHATKRGKKAGKLPIVTATRSLLTLPLALYLVASAAAHAQPYPDRAIRLVVPAGQGGPTDTLARLIAERLSASLRQNVVVENRGGGGGAIGARAVAHAEPDGYTFLFGNTGTLATIPAVSRSAGYDPAKNFAPVAKVMDSYQVLVVRPDFGVKSVAELIAKAKANPDKFKYGSAGLGNLTHLSGELFELRAGINLTPVHFKSGAEAITALLDAQIHLAIDNITVLHSLIQDGRLRALAVTGATRRPELPHVPTMLESGVPDYVVTSFFGVVAPAGTPGAIVERLNAEINAALHTPALRETLAKLGAEPSTGPSQQFTEFIASELQKWRDIATSAGIKVD
jgi:tripartite-type tricarboxylate transporter receptor subunit TctC